MAMGLASSSGVHPSASFCTLGNPPSHVSGQRGLLLWPAPPTSPPRAGQFVIGSPLLALAAPWLLLRPI